MMFGVFHKNLQERLGGGRELSHCSLNCSLFSGGLLDSPIIIEMLFGFLFKMEPVHTNFEVWGLIQLTGWHPQGN